MDRQKGSISYSTYFHIENVVDKTKSPDRFVNPDMEYDEEDPFDNKENFDYKDEEFLDKINANRVHPKAADVREFVNIHLPYVCDKIKRFDDYVKVSYDFDLF